MRTFVCQHSVAISEPEMKSLKKGLNGYLYTEYGFAEEDESRISEAWPFELRPVGTIHTRGGDTYVFEFWDGARACFAISGSSRTCYSTDGMTLDELCLQLAGAEWIGGHEPVNLEPIRLGDETIPSVKQRQAAIESLATAALPSASAPQILEGLHLRSTATYLALVRDPMSRKTFIVGSNMEPRLVDIGTETRWRKLSFGVGQMIAEGEPTETSQTQTQTRHA